MMEKRYANSALVYAAMALASGVFYREFTKFSGFSGRTNLAVMHTHYFLLGMVVFLLLMLSERMFGFSRERRTGVVVVLYHVGLNITALGFLLRGLVQVWGTELSRGMDAALSGVAGIGHILLGLSLILLLLRIKRRAVSA